MIFAMIRTCTKSEKTVCEDQGGIMQVLPLSRRDIIKGGVSMGLAPLGVSHALQQAKATSPAQPPIRIGVSTYSYWHFKTEKYPVERVIDEAARLGFDGV